MTREIDEARDWLFRGLMFEADAERFRRADIRVGADAGAADKLLFEEILGPFAVELRNRAVQMSRLYALVYCFENEVRDLVRERLEQHHGADWWTKGVPQKIQSTAAAKKASAEKNAWIVGERADLLAFTDFGELTQIVVKCWDAFSDLIPSQAWLKQRMDELEQARNFVAHNRVLQEREFRRMEMYVADWIRQVGV